MAESKSIELRPVSAPVDRTICLPGSKSLTNRALVAAALGHGESRLEGILLADDTLGMQDGLRALGLACTLDADRRRASVRGMGGHWPADTATIDSGGAGTVARFLTAVCCVGQGEFQIDGSARMRERPIGALVDALRELGARIEYHDREGYCPLTIHAAGLRGGVVQMRETVSSQFVSAILLAAPCAAGDVMLEIEGDLPSSPYVHMTLEVMRAFGVSALEDELVRFIIPGRQTYRATEYSIEPDATAASYFLGAAAVTGGRITIEGLGFESIQGDYAFVDVLEDMGCSIERGSRHTTVRGPGDGKLQGVDVDLEDMPDTAPTLAVLAAFSDGPTRIRGVGNLRIKESDRLFALSRELARMGVETEVLDDGLVIRPTRPPVAAQIETYDDHRMAMSFALAGLRVDGVVIKDPQCVNKTFPEFFDLWRDLTG